MPARRLIVVEGLEGAGKSTALQGIKQALTNLYPGAEIIRCREPGGTALGEGLRSIVKDPSLGEAVAPWPELLIMLAARVQLAERVIRPALARGAFVLCDRFYYSTLAYQGGGRGLDEAAIRQLHDLCLGELRPGLTFYLDIHPAIGLERARGRGALDRFETEQLDFFERIRTSYLAQARCSPEMHTVNAAQPQAQVLADIQAILHAQGF